MQVSEKELAAARARRTANGYKPSRDLYENYRKTASSAAHQQEVSVRDEDAGDGDVEHSYGDDFSNPDTEACYESIGKAMDAEDSERRDYHLRAARASLDRHFSRLPGAYTEVGSTFLKLPYSGRSIAILSFRR